MEVRMLVSLGKGLLLAGSLVLLTACSNGGKLSLEAGARKSSKGTPFVQVNQGGKALVIESGKTATTGVHGWVAVQSVASKNITDTGGNKIILNKTAAYH
jgi:hypothetical protein